MKASDFSSNWGTHNSVTNGDTNTFNIGSTVNIFGGAVNRFFSVEYGQVCPALTWVLAGKHYNWTLSKTAATGLKRETVGQKLSAINSKISANASNIETNLDQINSNKSSVNSNDLRLSLSDFEINKIKMRLKQSQIEQLDCDVLSEQNSVRSNSVDAQLSNVGSAVNDSDVRILTGGLTIFA